MVWQLFLVHLLAASAFIFAVTYAWAGLIYLYQRYSRRETEVRAKAFLNSYRGFLIGAGTRLSQGEITRPLLREKGKRGWGPFALVFILLVNKITLVGVLLGVGMLFFGGFIIALSWYGLHCLDVLRVESFAFTEPLPDAAPQLEQKHRIWAFWFSVACIALGIFGTDFYFYWKGPPIFQWWITIPGLFVFGFVIYSLYQKLMKPTPRDPRVKFKP